MTFEEKAQRIRELRVMRSSFELTEDEYQEALRRVHAPTEALSTNGDALSTADASISPEDDELDEWSEQRRIEQARNGRFAKVGAVLAAALFFGWLCGGSGEDPKPRRTRLVRASELQAEPQVAPPKTSYTVLEQQALGTTKLSVTVRLPEAVSETELKRVAHEIRRSQTVRYDGIRIVYYLPEMVVGERAWATTFFDPDLDIQILGFEEGRSETAVASSKSAGRTVMGAWRDQHTASIITLYEKDSTVYLEMRFSDGSASTDRVRVENTPNGKKISEIPANERGEYFVWDSYENLHLYDAEGRFSTAFPVK